MYHKICIIFYCLKKHIGKNFDSVKMLLYNCLLCYGTLKMFEDCHKCSRLQILSAIMPCSGILLTDSTGFSLSMLFINYLS
jgi:hypothetical protein